MLRAENEKNTLDRGSVLVEFVIVIPVIIVFFFSAMTIARKYYEITVLTNIARSAAILGASYHGVDSVCHTVEKFIVANLEGMGMSPKDYKLPETQTGEVGVCASSVSDMMSFSTLPGTAIRRLNVHIVPCHETTILTFVNGVIKNMHMNGFDTAVSAGISIDAGVDTSCM